VLFKSAFVESTWIWKRG